MLRTELYAVTTAAPDDLWAVVGDLWRLAEWTDADHVDAVTPDPPQVGTEVVTTERGQARTWQVVTKQNRLWEIATDAANGRLTVGFRVVRDPRGARLIMASGLEPKAKVGAVRARTVELPALRRRLDRWSAAALAVVTGR
jgi:hypothetical protein